ncbi:DUF4340 domain-containing protein [bacterium]|nr:DUF4340 domain-containing protein [bacterium]
MNKWIKILSGVVFLQLGLIALVYFFTPNMGEYTSGKKLLSFKPESIVKVSILSHGGGYLEVVKGALGWSMPKDFDAPVSNVRMEEFLNKLTSVTQTWPAASTLEAADGLKTSLDKAERVITLNDGKNDVKLILGDSPGIKKRYARVDGDSTTYPIEFELSETSVNPKDWIDWETFSVNAQDVAQIQYKDITVKKEGDVFTIPNLADDEEVNQLVLDSFVKSLLHVNMEDLLANTDKPSYAWDNPYVSWKVTLTSGDVIDFTISPIQPENAHVLKISKFPGKFIRVSPQTADKLKTYNLENLVQKKVPPADAPVLP